MKRWKKVLALSAMGLILTILSKKSPTSKVVR